jgi:hypothetical protein
VTPSRGPWERDRAETRDRSAVSASSVATASTTSRISILQARNSISWSTLHGPWRHQQRLPGPPTFERSRRRLLRKVSHPSRSVSGLSAERPHDRRPLDRHERDACLRSPGRGQSGKRVGGSARAHLELTDLELGGQVYAIGTNQIRMSAESKKPGKKILGGAAVGAGIGPSVDGGEGAAVGAVVGTAGGTAVADASSGNQVSVGPGAS